MKEPRSRSVELIAEHEVTGDLDLEIRALLRSGFPEEPCFASRRYYKQLPNHRLLCRDERGLLAHAARVHRVVSAEGRALEIFGVVDLVVRPDARGRGHGAALLGHFETLARAADVPFVILFAQDERLYRRCGYRRPGNRLQWLKIHEHRSLGCGDEVIDELMVKELGPTPWPSGPIDLLGHQF